MNKDFLPDWLPAVLVRDVRQLLRSPKYLVAALVVLVLLALNVRPDEPAESRAFGLSMATLLGCLVVPLRMGLVVEAETRAPGLNFIRLTRLSSWRVVWGMWLSGALQVLVLAGLMFAVMLWLRPAGELRPAEWLPYVLVVSQGWLFVALAQAFCKADGGVRILWFITAFLMQQVEAIWLGKSLGSCPDASACTPQLVVVLLAHGVMMLTFLAEARRPYALLAENCSVAVRWLSLGAVLLLAGVMLCGGESVFCGRVAAWGCCFVLLMACWGLLCPVPSVDGALAGVSRRGLWGSALWLVAAVGICALALVPLFMVAGYEALSGLWVFAAAGDSLAGAALWLAYAYFWVALAVCLLALALLCQAVRRLGAIVFLVGLTAEGTLYGWLMLGVPQSLPWGELLPLLPCPDLLVRLPATAYLLFLLGVKVLWLAALLGGVYALSRRK